MLSRTTQRACWSTAADLANAVQWFEKKPRSHATKSNTVTPAQVVGTLYLRQMVKCMSWVASSRSHITYPASGEIGTLRAFNRDVGSPQMKPLTKIQEDDALSLLQRQFSQQSSCCMSRLTLFIVYWLKPWKSTQICLQQTLDKKDKVKGRPSVVELWLGLWLFYHVTNWLFIFSII